MAAYDGNVFFSWGEVDRDFLCHSIPKPFLSALMGIHVDTALGKMIVDARITE
jgi:hypothetical protein